MENIPYVGRDRSIVRPGLSLVQQALEVGSFILAKREEDGRRACRSL
ncbi:hypothetical protein AB0B06_07085 [Streptomyces sp. NPDC044989]